MTADPDQHQEQPDPEVPSLAESFAAVARNAAVARVAPGEAPTGQALFAAIGGIRGLIESVVPGFAFLVVYTLTQDLWLSVLIPVAVGAVFVIVRAVTRTPVMPAVTGLLGIAVAAALALLTGNVNDNFVPGLITNAVFLIGLTVSILVRWPFIGVIAGLITGEGAAWRQDRRKLRVAYVATLLWVGMFALRLAVQAPMYLAEATQALAATKLIMGLPLYAAVLWVTWLLVRGAYAGARDTR
jgi:hypothetical protein